MVTRILLPLSEVIGEYLPSSFYEWIDESLHDVYFDTTDVRFEYYRGNYEPVNLIVLATRVGIDLPIISGLSLHVGLPNEYVEIEVTIGGELLHVQVSDIEITLHVPPTILTEYQLDPGTGVWSSLPEVEYDDESGEFLEVSDSKKGYDFIWETGIEANFEGDIYFTSNGPLSTTNWAMIADTGIVVRATNVNIVTNDITHIDESIDLPSGFQGVVIGEAQIDYVNEDTENFPRLNFRNLLIGTGGVGGHVFIGSKDNAEDDLSDGQLNGDEPLVPADAEYEFHRVTVNGAQAILQHFGIEFEQSVPKESSINGHMYLPFAEKWFKFKGSIGGPDGDLLINIAGAGDRPLISLDNKWLEIQADSIEYVLKDGIHYAAVSGSVRPKMPEDIDWPKFRVERLMVGSDGSIEIEGGWLDLPESITLDFYGFKIDIAEVGLGNDEIIEDGETKRQQWIGYSGAITLVEGLPISASVEGLKISWFPDHPDEDPIVSLNGIGVELEIPQTLSLKGQVSYERIEETDNSPLRGDLFKGAIELNLYALKTEISGELIIGNLTDTVSGENYTIFYIVLDADLPTPISLGTSGTAIYSLTGLFGMNVAPDRRIGSGEPENWYEWYKREEPVYNVTSINKWGPQPDHYAFGAGLTLGTNFDDGYSVHAKALVAILIPGPVIMIEGQANILKNRNTNDEEDRGAFYALAVFDGNAETFQLNVDVQYDLASVIAIRGSLEAFFDFNDPTNWHLHLGKNDPESKRIAAEILALFEANTYFMISARSLQTGAAVGFDWKAELGPVEVALIARIAFEAGIFWKPTQLEGLLELYGEISLKIFGIGFSLILEMLLEGSTPAPYWIHGRARVAIPLPWPLPDIDISVEFEWIDEEEPEPVPFLKGATLAHHKQKELGWEMSTDESTAPIVPVDSTAILSFARPIFNLSRQQDGSPVLADEVGEWKFEYHIRELTLSKKIDGAYDNAESIVHQSPSSADFRVIPEFSILEDKAYLPTRDAEEPQLQLWSKSPFDRSIRRWRETITDTYHSCETRIKAEIHCIDWVGIADGTVYPREFTYKNLNFDIDLYGPPRIPNISFGSLNTVGLTISWNDNTQWANIEVGPGADLKVSAYLQGAEVWSLERTEADTLINIRSVVFDSIRIIQLDHPNQPTIRIKSICYKTERAVIIEESTETPSGPAKTDPDEMLSNLVLEPHTEYRLSVDTQIKKYKEGQIPSIVSPPPPPPPRETFYFRTGGGPASDLNYLPAWDNSDSQILKYKDTSVEKLATYVQSTVPDNGSKRFYYGYDLAVEFNEGYVTKLYREAETLIIALIDRNGNPQEGDDEFWMDSHLPILLDSYISWLLIKERAGCPENNSLVNIPTLRRRMTSLTPEHLYTAVLKLSTSTEELPTDFSFQFTTSKYKNFVEHILSGADDTSTQKFTTLTNIDDATYDLSRMTERDALNHKLSTTRSKSSLFLSESDRSADKIVTNLDSAVATLKQIEKLNHKTFDDLYTKLGLEWTPLPPKTEFHLFRMLTDRVLIIQITSPEPIEWERVLLHLLTISGGEVISPIWNTDKTNAFIIFKDDDEFEEGIRLDFEYSGQIAELPLITQYNSTTGASEPVLTNTSLTINYREE